MFGNFTFEPGPHFRLLILKPVTFNTNIIQFRIFLSLQDVAPEAEHGLLLGGVWNYRKPADDISFNSDDELSDDDRTTFTDSDSTLSTPQLNSSDFSFFDPLLDGSYTTETNDKSTPKLSSLIDDFDTPESDHSSAYKDNQIFNFPDVLSDVIKVDKLTESHATPSKSDGRQALRDVDFREFDPLGSTSVDHLDGGVHAIQPLSPLTPTIGVISTDVQQYLFDAASLISLAQQHEVNNNYEKAFHYYKMGIDKLLSGVQTEANPLRRDAVRRKISHYLQRADQLYASHIAVDPKKDKVWGVSCCFIYIQGVASKSDT